MVNLTIQRITSNLKRWYEMKYRPKRASKRWLENAPDYILSVHDNPKYADRYTVFFCGHLWGESMGRTVQYLAMSSNPTHPQGISMWGETLSCNREASGRKIRWMDLPENIRKHVIMRATE